MASFGGFDSEREVYSDPIYAVYNARKRGDPKGEYAVKVFRFSGSDLEAELAHEAGGRDELVLARWSSIMVQEKAGAASKFVAPIFEKGNDERGIWYATRFYPRSVNKMMSGKVALPPASLHHILYSIAQGAYDLKRECGRSHGDIQPTKVQVSKSEKLTEAEVVLSDPLAGGEEEAAQYEVNDLHAIGLILLQLVRQRLLSHDDVVLMLPIVASAEWTRVFGARADEWLALCNRLLDPNLSPEQFSLEALLSRLEELKPKRGSSATKLVTVSAVALVLLGALGLWRWWPRAETVEVTSDPDGATILVDNANQAAGTTPIHLELSKGSHMIVGRHDQLGLGAVTTKCDVTTGASPRVHLKFTYGRVLIKSDPPGASISKDGVALGRTKMDGQPFTIPSVVPGPVKYQLTLERYEPAEVTGVVSNLQTLELTATLRTNEVVTEVTPMVETNAATTTTPPLGQGTIELKAEPVPALILDPDGHEVGSASVNTPLKLTNAPGKYAYAARNPGFEEVLATLTFEAGVASKYTFVFPYGKVEWKTEPVAATVTAGSTAMTNPAVFIQKPGVVTRYVITAPGYQSVTNDLTLKKGDRKIILTNLFPLLVSVQLASDPEGAEFFGQNGAAFPRTDKATYMLPLGATNLVARYARLGAITNQLELTPDRAHSTVKFNFHYGSLYLTNLPPDVLVYEGETKVGSAANGYVYQKPGPHVYALRGRSDAVKVEMSISTGFNVFHSFVAQKSWRNFSGILLTWVPGLPGGGEWLGQTESGGWVGVSEVTQAQYKKMDGSDPSAYRAGGDNCPVENVTWDQAMKYCKWLSATNNTSEHSGWRYTLPTEEQFTFFAADADLLPKVSSEIRVAVQDTRFNPQQLGAKIPAIEKLGNNSGTRLHPEPVASTKANSYALYDVVGNVCEWLDHSNGKPDYYAGGSYLLTIPKTGGTKVREHGLDKGPNIGFRVILVPSQ